MVKLISLSLFVLAVGLLSSISLMSVFHFSMIPAILFYSRSYSWKKFPKSGWALLSLCVILILSVWVNHDIISRPLKNILKVKYYLIGALSIVPFSYYFQKHLNLEQRNRVLKRLLWILLISASLATLSGLIGYFFGFNPLLGVEVSHARNGGLFGMVMTYGHSMAWLTLFVIGLSFQSEKVKNFISLKWLVFFSSIFLIGLFTSHVRGAWIAFFAGCFWINKRLTLFLILLCILGAGLLSLKDPRFLNNQILRVSSNEERLGCWLAAIKAVQEKPLLGYGYLNFEPNSRAIKERYHLPYPEFSGHAHNDLLEVLATSGLLGGACFLLWIFLWFQELLRRKDLSTQWAVPILVGFLASGLTQVTFNDGENTFFLMLVYALSIVL
ncbi:MAG: O-antigen ligase family protein [Deltaproteobacteria bacterium]|nr:O-antigen ligase family protein [Deltaproteobacteria bacterium]